jgi:HK97 family phage major capsid protein
VFAHFHLSCYRNDAHFHVGYETLKSSAVPLESILNEACARALAEKLAGDLASGVGSTTAPQGMSGHATALLTTGVTTASADAITMDEIIGLKLSVLPMARANGSFIFASTAYVLLAKLKNDAGSYYWEPSNQAQTPDRLLGCPCYEDAGYDVMGTTAHEVATFGDMSTYYVRFGGPVIIEASDAPTWTSFETTWRCAQWVGAWPSDINAIKCLKLI